IRYSLNLDYSVTILGSDVVIQLIEPNPSGLTPTSQVIVDYEAAPQGTGTVDGQLANATIRLDLINGMLGIYGRYDNADYSADTNIVVQDLREFAFGVDFYRQWLRAGAEYEIYDSTFTSYDAARLFQTFTFTPDEVSSLSINLSQSWTDYRSANRT